mmetsp:Transcript_92432/g.287733  ORF Transcript_92432/g.287733 Transcript_92432/m.287733 type:complete len:367 (-) Transcript_92432:1418-2518(-)
MAIRPSSGHLRPRAECLTHARVRAVGDAGPAAGGDALVGAQRFRDAAAPPCRGLQAAGVCEGETPACPRVAVVVRAAGGRGQRAGALEVAGGGALPRPVRLVVGVEGPLALGLEVDLWREDTGSTRSNGGAVQATFTAQPLQRMHQALARGAGVRPAADAVRRARPAHGVGRLHELACPAEVAGAHTSAGVRLEVSVERPAGLGPGVVAEAGGAVDAAVAADVAQGGVQSGGRGVGRGHAPRRLRRAEAARQGPLHRGGRGCRWCRGCGCGRGRGCGCHGHSWRGRRPASSPQAAPLPAAIRAPRQLWAPAPRAPPPGRRSAAGAAPGASRSSSSCRRPRTSGPGDGTRTRPGRRRGRPRTESRTL